MLTELAPGSIVMSNAFSTPGWRPEPTSRQGTHVHVAPPAPRATSNTAVEDVVPKENM